MDCLGPGDEPSLQIHNYAFEHHSNILLFFGLLCVCLWGVCVVLVVLFSINIYTRTTRTILRKTMHSVCTKCSNIFSYKK